MALVFGLAAWRAEGEPMVLGSDHSINELLSGPYGELFPGGTAAAPENMVLALDVVSANGSRQRWLVPSTESADRESSEILVYERASDRVYLFWETLINGIHPALHLTSFGGSGWGQQIDFIGSPFARKKSLELVISRDSEARLLDGGSEVLTVLNVFWAEERPGTSEKRYAPILLVNGEYSGSTPVYDLGSLFASAEGAAGDTVSLGILDGLQAQVGTNSRSCVVGFIDPSSHRLITLEIEVLPPSLTFLADKIRAEIIGLGQRSESLAELALGVAGRLDELGGGFHPSVLSYMIGRIDALIESEATQPSTDEQLGLLADKIRAEIIGLGSRIELGGLVAVGDVQFLQLDAADSEEFGHLLKVTSVSSRQAPEVGGDATLWLSESGRHVLVTWEDEGGVYYRETRDENDGWTDVAVIAPDSGLGREEIYRTLAERVRGR